MNFFDTLLLGVSLSMDASAVSISNGLAYGKLSFAKKAAMPLFFGVFQAIMPLLGYLAAGLFADIISRVSKYIILAVFLILGGKMLYDAIREIVVKEEVCEVQQKQLTYRLLLVQAIATSIDAFAVGISFVAGGLDIWDALCSVGLIGLTTAVLSMIAVFAGRKFGCRLGSKAQLLGGIILVLLAVKTLF